MRLAPACAVFALPFLFAPPDPAAQENGRQEIRIVTNGDWGSVQGQLRVPAEGTAGPTQHGVHFREANVLGVPTHAQYIWGDFRAEGCLERAIDVPPGIRRAEMLFVADDEVEISVNSSRVDFYSTGAATWGERGCAVLVDLLPWLEDGCNLLRARVANRGGCAGFVAEIRIDGESFVTSAVEARRTGVYGPLSSPVAYGGNDVAQLLGKIVRDRTAQPCLLRHVINARDLMATRHDELVAALRAKIAAGGWEAECALRLLIALDLDESLPVLEDVLRDDMDCRLGAFAAAGLMRFAERADRALLERATASRLPETGRAALRVLSMPVPGDPLRKDHGVGSMPARPAPYVARPLNPPAPVAPIAPAGSASNAGWLIAALVASVFLNLGLLLRRRGAPQRTLSAADPEPPAKRLAALDPGHPADAIVAAPSSLAERLDKLARLSGQERERGLKRMRQTLEEPLQGLEAVSLALKETDEARLILLAEVVEGARLNALPAGAVTELLERIRPVESPAARRAAAATLVGRGWHAEPGAIPRMVVALRRETDEVTLRLLERACRLALAPLPAELEEALGEAA